MGPRSGDTRMAMKEFFYMGGYAFYVWTSYAVVGIVLFLNFLIPLLRRRRLLRDLARRTNRDQIPS